MFGFGMLTRAQTQYIVYRQGNDLILKGTIPRELLERDPSFSWFGGSQAGYAPDPSSRRLLDARASRVNIYVFAGTWDPESRFLLPRLFAFLQYTGFPQEQVTLIGLDREKKSMDDLPERMRVKAVPTIILTERGQEIGRISLTGKRSTWEQELIRLLAASIN